MKTFAIDSENNITAYATPEQVPERHMPFSGERELGKASAEWPASRLVEIWNSLPGVSPVRKFTDRKTAVIRIVKAIQSLEPALASQPLAAGRPTLEPELAAPAPTPPVSETAQLLAGTLSAARSGSKKALVIELLRRDQGATLKEIAAATDWQAHSIRGFLSGSISKKMRLKIESRKRPDGQRAYVVHSE